MIGFPGGGPSAVPFPAIVGQERLKQALLAVSVNDAIDGLLIRGEKGTAKSTAVRALVDLLPNQRVVADCPYGCPPEDPASQCETCRSRPAPPVTERPVPLVTVPLGATRERIVGSLSVRDALDGEANFDPGLLARANRGFLYVDEVNLLDDHLVDVLLSAAASGVNHVERDGMSVTHPADFTLLGTMNPEEGDLRPQLRDRFAIQATVAGTEDTAERVEIIETALGRDTSAERRKANYEETVRERRESVQDARSRLDEVDLATAFKETIAAVCTDAGVDGHRGDIAAARTAIAFAALDGRTQVVETDVREALELALPHRLQSRPFEEGADLEDILEEHFDGPEGDTESEAEDDEAVESDADGDGSRDDGRHEMEPEDGAQTESHDEGGAADAESPGGADMRNEPDGEQQTNSPTSAVGDQQGDDPEGGETRPSSRGPPPELDMGPSSPQDAEGEADADDSGSSAEDAEDSKDVRPARPAHRPAPVGEGTKADIELDDEDAGSITETMSSGRVETEPSTDAIGPRVRTEPARSPATVDATASVREAAKNGRTSVTSRDLRQSVNAGTATALVVFAVDASASMRQAIAAAKGTVMELLKQAYQERDEVAFVAFAGEDAEVLLPPTDSVTLAARHLKELPTGDRTPLPAGLDAVKDLIDRADPAASVAVVVTDGRPTVADGSPTASTRASARALGRVADQVLVVDAGDSTDAVSLIGDIAAETEGRVIPLEDLSRDSVSEEVGRARE